MKKIMVLMMMMGSVTSYANVACGTMKGIFFGTGQGKVVVSVREVTGFAYDMTLRLDPKFEEKALPYLVERLGQPKLRTCFHLNAQDIVVNVELMAI